MNILNEKSKKNIIKYLYAMKNKNIPFPTKQVRGGLMKIFFNKRYLWPSKKRVFKTDVLPAPEWFTNLSNWLYNKKIITHTSDILVANGYFINEANPGIGAHKDEGFNSDISSLSLLSDCRLAFKIAYKGSYGHGAGFFAIPLLKNSINIMENDSFIKDKMDHQIFPKDVIGDRFVLLFRNTK